MKEPVFTGVCTALVTPFDAQGHISLSMLEAFEDGADVTVEALLEKGIIRDPMDGVKVLANGKLTKKLNVTVNAFSAGAKARIEELGGKAEVI